jgi:hypothetical protein
LLDNYEKQIRAIKEEALRFTWWLRGGLSYEDAMLLCQTDKELINTIIKDNMEATKTSGMPFF